jgi:hypothetical protein
VKKLDIYTWLVVEGQIFAVTLENGMAYYHKCNYATELTDEPVITNPMYMTNKIHVQKYVHESS